MTAEVTDAASADTEAQSEEDSALSNGSHGKWISGVWTPLTELGASSRRVIGDSMLSPRLEYVFYGALFAIALGMRLIKLGDQAVHHDESLHGYFGWKVSIGETYVHTPLTHGMFLFEIIAASFLLFGDSEFTMRLSMAVFGSALVLIPWLLRNHLGQVGALCVAVLLAVSPGLFYFSRFARNDIFMGFFALLLVVAMFRYIDERRMRWLVLGAVVAALAMATKETAYIYMAIFGLYLALRARGEIVEVLLGYRRLRDIGPTGEFLIMLAGIILPFAAPLISVFQGVMGLILAAHEGTPNVAVGAPDGTVAYVIAASVTLILFAIGAGVGILGMGRRFLVLLAIFWSIYALVMTNFGAAYSGVPTGVWQSMGYWLAQHDVRRGNQPWYYYFMLMSVYEFLPFIFALGIATYYAIKSRVASIGLILIGLVSLTIAAALFFGAYFQAPAGESPSPLFLMPFLIIGFGALLWMPFTLDAPRFTQFLIFWAIATFITYSWAGEKMPWLLVNVALPVIVLGGKAIGQALVNVDWGVVLRRRGWMAFPLVPLFFIVLWRLAIFNFAPDFSLSNLSDVGKFLELWALIAFIGLMALGLFQLGQTHGYKQAGSIVAVSLAALLLVFTIRASAIAGYVHGDVPNELLIYTQTTPDLHQTAREIANARLLIWDQTLNDLRGLPDEFDSEGVRIEPPSGFSIAIDTRDGFAWPWTWYLRGYDDVAFVSLDEEGNTVNDDRTIAVVNAKNNSHAADSMPDHFGEGRHMIHRWWFPENYRHITPGKVWNSITNRQDWRKTADFWLYRKLPSEIGYVDSYVYFSEDLPNAPLR